MTTADKPVQHGIRYVVERSDFDRLLSALHDLDYAIVGPRIRDGAILCEEISGSEDLPVGWTDLQDGGTYRLRRREDEALFGYPVGPDSWKKFLFPPRVSLMKAQQEAGTVRIESQEPAPRRLAFLGVRSCDLHAIAVQDRVFVDGPYIDPIYQSQRRNLCLIAVNCGQAGGTCFCESMGTGPGVDRGFDLALTEVIEPGEHYFVVDVGSDLGASILGRIPHRLAGRAQLHAAEGVVDNTAAHMGRTMDATDLNGLLRRNYEHPRWDDVASRCLTCGNCTLVCPTCFCSSIEDTTDLTGQTAERSRRWESCFTLGHSYIHGGTVRSSPRSRYRQWMTHKLGTWWDQFGTSGCVGCGRCITWCPVAIDLTEEMAAIRATESSEIGSKGGNEHGNT